MPPPLPPLSPRAKVLALALAAVTLAAFVVFRAHLVAFPGRQG